MLDHVAQGDPSQLIQQLPGHSSVPMQCVGPGLVLRMGSGPKFSTRSTGPWCKGNCLTEILCNLHGMGGGSCCYYYYYYFCCCCCSSTFLHLGLRKLFALTQQLFKAGTFASTLLVHDDPAHPAVDKFEDLTTTKLVCK